MVTTKKIGSSKRKELYNQVLMLTAEHFNKEIPSDLVESISRGPGTKYPTLLCSFLMALKELTDKPLSEVLSTYNIEKEDAVKIVPKWTKYYAESKFLQKDVAIICMLVREKFCNNNKQYE